MGKVNSTEYQKLSDKYDALEELMFAQMRRLEGRAQRSKDEADHDLDVIEKERQKIVLNKKGTK